MHVFAAPSPGEVWRGLAALIVAVFSQVALVQWTESVGLTLVGRDQSSVQLRTPGGHILNFTILQIFPFTYESKRMGIIVRVSVFGGVFLSLGISC